MASTDGVPQEPKAQVKIKAILDLLVPNGEIDNAAKKQQAGMSELGLIYKRVEKDMHGNRAAVALIRRFDKMDADKRNDLIRTLEPLLVERGYTLDVIDPEDLVASAPNKGGDADDVGQPGDNASTSALDNARAAMTGGAPIGNVEPGSAQLKKYLQLRRGGEDTATAAETAGIGVDEAAMHDEAESRGEYSHIKTPGGSKKPRLSIAASDGATIQ